MSSVLFSPIALGDLTLPNRVMVAPMCQYSAEDGAATDWHLQHLGGLSLSGAGLVVVEATAVEPAGRITPGDLGLYDDRTEAALARAVALCRGVGGGRLGIQLAHAGRKASCRVPWQGGDPIAVGAGGWTTVAPSALPFAAGAAPPVALDRDGLARIRRAFADTARRAARIGFDLAELHAAHGYLLHEFLSPLSNRREDAYGGSLENRMRFPLEVFDAVREVWPAERPLGARITGTDWTETGFRVEDAIAFAGALKARGCAYVCVSSGGILPDIRIPVGPGYQVPLAEAVRAATGIPTRAVGMIADPHQAEDILVQGKADLIALARAMLDDPRWPWHAAQALGDKLAYPPQYARSAPEGWRGYELAHGTKK